MIDALSEQNQERKSDLIRTYVNAPQFGLVLGAGVTAASGVPEYGELALRLLERASETGRIAPSAEWVRSFVAQQRAFLSRSDRRAAPPEEVVLFVRQQLAGDDELLRQMVQEALYRDVPVGKTVGRGTFERNATLDALLAFCAARPNTVLAPALDPPLSHRQRAVETNVKVGGILTTNYDNLVEGAFHTKYRTNLLKPVGRPTSTEADRDRRLLPVYHVHGYVGYRDQPDDEGDPQDPGLVISQEDYYQAFYDPLGFGTYVAMSFLRRFPCLFVGCSMQDKNLRRFLFHLVQKGVGTDLRQGKFALLKVSGTPQDDLADAILLSYGVHVIWMERFCQIPGILRDLYVAVRGVSPSDWGVLARYRWGDLAR